MADYRGGGREMSRHGAGLVKAINEGRTERQYRRNLEQKIAFAAVQAGLTGLSGAVSADESNKLQAKQALRSSADKYKAPEYTGRAGDVPDWLGKAGEGNTDVLQPSGPADMPYAPDVISSADNASSRLKANQARENAPMGGWYTAQARERENGESSALANDMVTAEMGMRGGITPIGIPSGSGMMGSLPARRR